jgi:hypothetical protein
MFNSLLGRALGAVIFVIGSLNLIGFLMMDQGGYDGNLLWGVCSGLITAEGNLIRLVGYGLAIGAIGAVLYFVGPPCLAVLFAVIEWVSHKIESHDRHQAPDVDWVETPPPKINPATPQKREPDFSHIPPAGSEPVPLAIQNIPRASELFKEREAQIRKDDAIQLKEKGMNQLLGR